ncbi:MAG: hypothetical protein QM498_09800 [Desulfobacterium sp.]
MTVDKKKIATITGAVFTYIKTNEEAAYVPSQLWSEETLSDLPTVGDTDSCHYLWSSAGRTEQMQLRAMMQMRAFK